MSVAFGGGGSSKFQEDSSKLEKRFPTCGMSKFALSTVLAVSLCNGLYFQVFHTSRDLSDIKHYSSVPATWRNTGIDISLDDLMSTKKPPTASSTPMKQMSSASGNSLPAGSVQPNAYGQPAGMVGYQQPAMMGTWQPGVMGVQGMTPPGMMAGAMPSAAYMQPRPPMGYVQQPVMPVGMPAPAAYAPSTFGTSVQTAASQWQ